MHDHIDTATQGVTRDQIVALFVEMKHDRERMQRLFERLDGMLARIERLEATQ